jgi:histidyl-tRNA synthetase
MMKWLATPEWTQPLFPPLPLTNVLQFTTVKSFRNESFLRQKYIAESASLDEIAVLTLSSRRTVRQYLIHYQIPLRPKDRLIQEPERFGMRRVDGELTEDLQEMMTLNKLHALRKQGCTYREIVKTLNDLNIPCRKSGAKWHLKTVFNYLQRQQ